MELYYFSSCLHFHLMVAVHHHYFLVVLFVCPPRHHVRCEIAIFHGRFGCVLEVVVEGGGRSKRAAFASRERKKTSWAAVLRPGKLLRKRKFEYEMIDVQYNLLYYKVGDERLLQHRNVATGWIMYMEEGAEIKHWTHVYWKKESWLHSNIVSALFAFAIINYVHTAGSKRCSVFNY